MQNIQIESRILGPVATNCYFIKNTDTGELLVIDPAEEPERIAMQIEKMQGKPVAILLTHGHFDHIGAAMAIKEKYQIPIYALREEEEILLDVRKNLSGMYGGGFTVAADHYLMDGEELFLAGFDIRVIHTPGHTAGGACYYFPKENVLFSGDTLFQCSVGRTDFPTGSMGKLHTAIHTKLYVLPEETVVYPGHGESTDIRYEKRYNPY